MNKQIAAFILGWKYDLKCRGVAKSKWRKIIGDHFVDSKAISMYPNGADQFVKTWEELEKMGRI